MIRPSGSDVSVRIGVYELERQCVKIPSPHERAGMTHEEIRTLVNGSDTYAAVESIAKSGDALTAAKLFLTITTDLYWKSKDLTKVMAIGSAGVTFGLTRAVVEADQTIAEQLRGTAKAISYNLGSFCWPGWAEPGIEIGKNECAFGHDAAKCNLRLAIELKRPAKAMGNAYWLIGAYELVNREFDQALKAFELAQNALADERAMALMAAGYRELAKQLRSDGKSPELEKAKAALVDEGSDDGKAFAEQLTTVEAAMRQWYKH